MSVARAVVVDHLPGDRAVALFERQDEALFLLAADRPLAEVAEQLTGRMQENIDIGGWLQHWGDPGAPPHRIAS